MFKAKTITRTSRRVDEGTMGFHDYETYWEKAEEFANRVMEEANKIKNVKGIQFAEKYAVIIYTED